MSTDPRTKAEIIQDSANGTFRLAVRFIGAIGAAAGVVATGLVGMNLSIDPDPIPQEAILAIGIIPIAVNAFLAFWNGSAQPPVEA